MTSESCTSDRAEPTTVDVTDAAYWDDPHPVLRAAREQRGVAFASTGEPIVLRYADVKRLAGDHASLSNALAFVERQVSHGPLVERWRLMLTNLNGMEHRQRCSLVNKAFTPRRADEKRARVHEDPGLAASAVLARERAEDFAVDGVTIPAGQPFLLSVASANRDSAVFDRPDEFDIGRSGAHSFSFGWGPHRCLGAASPGSRSRSSCPPSSTAVMSWSSSPSPAGCTSPTCAVWTRCGAGSGRADRMGAPESLRRRSRRRAGRWLAAAVVALSSATAGCQSIGPRTVAVDQFDYAQTIADASTEQLLMNMVRLRYSEPTSFLRVSSVISQYRRGSSVALGAGLNAGATGADTGSVGGTASWADRPTITYTPITGREFTRTLLTPLPVRAIFNLLEAGAPTDLAIRLSLASINGVHNESTRPAGRRQADPAFFETIELLGWLRAANAITVRQTNDPGAPAMKLVLRKEEADEEVAAAQARFRELLDLPPALSEFRLVRGLLPTEPGEVAVLTRSLSDVMLDLAWRFQVPEEHIEEGRTAEDFESPRRAPIVVSASRSRPDHAFVAVESRDHWFYIDDRDRASKRVFSFVHMLLSLAEQSEPARGPILTLD